MKSFPPTKENYDKVIDSLKSRFGRDELLVEVYVRELLALVLQNTVKNREKPSLASLYDKLESHMRALETLGVTTDKCAAMLFPLVESSLPEDILRAWQRASNTVNTADSKDRLTKLLAFLRSEVENEERISMAVLGFSLSNDASDNSKKIKVKTTNPKDIPTVANLLNVKTGKILQCVFCKSTHNSADCEKAKLLSLEERRKIVKDDNCCFCCLKRGHRINKCYVQVKCNWCSKKHVLLMCPELGRKECAAEVKNDSSANVKDCALANFMRDPEVYLQTLRVKVRSDTRECDVRVIIDTGSQKSYVKSEIASAMNYDSLRSVEITHSLFGGVKSTVQQYNVYRIHLKI